VNGEVTAAAAAAAAAAASATAALLATPLAVLDAPIVAKALGATKPGVAAEVVASLLLE